MAPKSRHIDPTYTDLDQATKNLPTASEGNTKEQAIAAWYREWAKVWSPLYAVSILGWQKTESGAQIETEPNRNLMFMVPGVWL